MTINNNLTLYTHVLATRQVNIAEDFTFIEHTYTSLGHVALLSYNLDEANYNWPPGDNMLSIDLQLTIIYEFTTSNNTLSFSAERTTHTSHHLKVPIELDDTEEIMEYEPDIVLTPIVYSPNTIEDDVFFDIKIRGQLCFQVRKLQLTQVKGKRLDSLNKDNLKN